MAIYLWAMILLRWLSKLPLGVLYFFADVISVLNFYLIRYRKSIIRKNLNIAFPELSTRDESRIVKAFYQNLAEVMMESIKAISTPSES